MASTASEPADRPSGTALSSRSRHHGSFGAKLPDSQIGAASSKPPNAAPSQTRGVGGAKATATQRTSIATIHSTSRRPPRKLPIASGSASAAKIGGKKFRVCAIGTEASTMTGMASASASCLKISASTADASNSIAAE